MGTVVSNQSKIPGYLGHFLPYGFMRVHNGMGIDGSCCDCRAFISLSAWFKIWEDILISVSKGSHFSFASGSNMTPILVIGLDPGFLT